MLFFYINLYTTKVNIVLKGIFFKSRGDQMTVGRCMRCKADREMKNEKVVVNKRGMKMAKGQCVKCGCNMCKILGKA